MPRRSSAPSSTSTTGVDELGATRVPISVDPEQSQFSHRPWGSQVSVFIIAESSLDIATRFKLFDLDIEMSDGLITCTFDKFQRESDAKLFSEAVGIEIPPKNQVEGWAHFYYPGVFRRLDFQRFLLRVCVIGEREQEFRFEPYDWDDARKAQSDLVALD